MNINSVSACLIPLFFICLQASDTQPSKEEQQKHLQTALAVVQDLHEKLHPPIVPLVLAYVGNGTSEIDLKSLWEEQNKTTVSRFGIYSMQKQSGHALNLNVCFLAEQGGFLQAGTCVYDNQNDTVTINEEIRRITNYTCSSPTGRMRFMPRPIHTPDQLFQDQCSELPKSINLDTPQVTTVSTVGWIQGQGASICNITKPYSPENYLAKAYSHFVMSQLKRNSNTSS